MTRQSPLVDPMPPSHVTLVRADTQEQWVIASAGCHCLLDLVTVTLRDSCEGELQEAGEAAYLLVTFAGLGPCVAGALRFDQRLFALGLRSTLRTCRP